MPIEIRELIIKATVGHAVPEQPQRGSDSSGVPISPVEKKAIIEECIERVMETLAKQKER